jgi:hypothetical protein
MASNLTVRDEPGVRVIVIRQNDPRWKGYLMMGGGWLFVFLSFFFPLCANESYHARLGGALPVGLIGTLFGVYTNMAIKKVAQTICIYADRIELTSLIAKMLVLGPNSLGRSEIDGVELREVWHAAKGRKHLDRYIAFLAGAGTGSNHTPV